MTSGGREDEEYRREVAKRAYAIYEARGRLPGFEDQDWEQAERELAGSTGQTPVEGPGPNVPINTEGRGERASEVMPDVDRPREGEPPERLPPGP